MGAQNGAKGQQPPGMQGGQSPYPPQGGQQPQQRGGWPQQAMNMAQGWGGGWGQQPPNGGYQGGSSMGFGGGWWGPQQNVPQMQPWGAQAGGNMGSPNMPPGYQGGPGQNVPQGGQAGGNMGAPAQGAPATGTDDWFKQRFDQIWQVDPRLAKEFQNSVMTEHVADGKGLGNRMQGWIKEKYFGKGSDDPNQMNAVDQKYAQWINLATAGGGGGNAPQLTPEQRYWMMKMSDASPQAMQNFKAQMGYKPEFEDWTPARMTMDDLMSGTYARGLERYNPSQAAMNPDGTFKEGIPPQLLQASGVRAGMPLGGQAGGNMPVAPEGPGGMPTAIGATPVGAQNVAAIPPQQLPWNKAAPPPAMAAQRDSRWRGLGAGGKPSFRRPPGYEQLLNTPLNNAAITR